uniref:Uncharacterized protein n=1 Tax=Moniliophthora roreri TaxID=221103 RepID=A0A0W0FYG0_MONRR
MITATGRSWWHMPNWESNDGSPSGFPLCRSFRLHRLIRDIHAMEGLDPFKEANTAYPVSF